MTEVARPRYTIAANLRWFALLFLLASLAASFAATALAFYTQPTAVALSAWIGAFALAAWIASDRFAERRGADVRKRRADLAIGYVILAAAITLLFPIFSIVLMTVAGGGLTPEASHNVFGVVLSAILATFVGIIVNYVVAWFIIGRRRAGEETT